MLGSFAVGKTSLIRRFIVSIFEEKYQTSVGVKVDKKQISIDNHQLNMMLWDLAGEDTFNSLQQNFLRGSSGFILVADGTRSSSLEKSLELYERIRSDYPEAAFILVLNKVDLKDHWQITDDQIEALKEDGWRIFLTSAKTGEQVELIFEALGRLMLGLEVAV
ncbi:Rab family GTPase [Mariprofundus sp. NF]|uniref:Rab family GTPase n=1 Tax=Mariprofundus sp. NF TaxID=2608716 RepID=UPI0019D64A32|nr:Rab family GTPase [Mariprofundus sp. NF]